MSSPGQTVSVENLLAPAADRGGRGRAVQKPAGARQRRVAASQANPMIALSKPFDL